MKNKKTVTLFALLALALATSAVHAKVAPEEAAKLGKDLTPVGAEKNGNADGSIPAWAPYAQHGKLSGEYTTDAKMDAEKPLFTITKANMAQYAALLTEGYKKLLSTYEIGRASCRERV